MTLTAAIIANLGLMLAIIAGLAYAMTRPAKLTAHFATTTAPSAPQAQRRRTAARPRASRTPVAVGS